MPLMRNFFIALSKNKTLRKFAEHSRVGVKMSSRFIAGMTIEDALRVAEAVNRQGIEVTLDSLGESVTSPEEAHRAAAIYHQLLDQIASRHLDANISVKLTQMGLTVDRALAEEIALELTRRAARTDSFVRIDMEDSSLTQVTLDIVRSIHAAEGLAGRIGTVIQSYLYRSEQDVAQLAQEKIRVRLCKGAYNEPATVAFREKSDVDEAYARLTGVLLESGAFHGLATHDERMIRAAKSYAQAHGIEPARFEFQMLYGVRRDLQKQLVEEGYRVRVYVPFGTEWYPYFMRRLAERPANVLFILKNLLRQ